jgi:hypothetical protein
VTSTKMQPARRHVVAAEDRRRSQRVVIRVPVTILTTENGQPVRTTGKTIEVNTHGAMVACSRSFDPNAKLEVVNERTGEKVASRVTRSPREAAEGFLVPLEFTAPSDNFWQITFPPDNWKAPEN